MTDVPKTVRSSEFFQQSPPAGFDGFMHWEWMRGTLPRDTIQPMDVDAWIEINHRYLIFETKHDGAEIPKGQLQALTRLTVLSRGITVICQWGKDNPREWQIVRHKICTPVLPVSIQLCRHFVKQWGVLVDRDFIQYRDLDQLVEQFCDDARVQNARV